MKSKIVLSLFLLLFLTKVSYGQYNCPDTKEGVLAYLNMLMKVSNIGIVFVEEDDSVLGMITTIEREILIKEKNGAKIMMEEASFNWSLVSDNKTVKLYDSNFQIVFEYDGAIFKEFEISKNFL